MIVGILSDSHGQHERTRTALDLLGRLGAERFVHCGDVCSTSVLDAFAGRDLRFVWGNCDPATPDIVNYAQSLGLRPPTAIPTLVEADDAQVAVFHGHEPLFARLARAIELDDADAFAECARGSRFICCGHTHQAMVLRFADALLVNPGALCRAAVYTVATLDTQSADVEHWVVPEQCDADATAQRFSPG